MGCLSLQKPLPYQPEDKANTQNGQLRAGKNLGSHWHVWDTGSTDSEPPISSYRFPVTWPNKFIFKVRLSWDSCYLFWWNTFPFHGCLPVKSFGLLRLGPSCQGQLPADRCRISIILSPFFNSTISPSLESLAHHHLSLSILLLIKWQP